SVPVCSRCTLLAHTDTDQLMVTQRALQQPSQVSDGAVILGPGTQLDHEDRTFTADLPAGPTIYTFAFHSPRAKLCGVQPRLLRLLGGGWGAHGLAMRPRSRARTSLGDGLVHNLCGALHQCSSRPDQNSDQSIRYPCH